ncbi:MAG: aminotransferase class IV [Acidimicrobiia bacterium]
MKVWVNGVVDDVSRMRVSPLDHGLLVGDGVFETLRVYGGALFAWRRHHERLAFSAAGIGLEVPDSAALRSAAESVLAANGLRQARLRITITGGESPLGSERGEATPTVIIAASELAPRPPDADVVTVPWARNERGAIAGLKTISYAENVRALAYAREHGAVEAVFPNTRGELCEATGSNVFLVFQKVLHTPPGEAGCLLGVTRALLLELAGSMGIPVEEAALPLDALHRADEAFLSSTTREVQAIARVDGQKLPAAPGPMTVRLADAFTELVGRDLDP